MLDRSLRLLVASCLVAVGIACHAAPARAGLVTFTAASGGSALAGQNYANFDDLMTGRFGQTTGSGLTVNFTGGGFGFVRGSVSGLYAAPVLSGGNDNFFATASNPASTGADMTTYLTTGDARTDTAIMTFAGGSATYFGLLWGSIGQFDSLTFNFTDGTSQEVTGAAVINQLGTSPTGSAYVNFLGSAFTSVVATTQGYNFEFDNVAFGSGVIPAAVPEPSSVALCGIAGLVGLVVARSRRPAVA